MQIGGPMKGAGKRNKRTMIRKNSRNRPIVHKAINCPSCAVGLMLNLAGNVCGGSHYAPGSGDLNWFVMLLATAESAGLRTFPFSTRQAGPPKP